MKRLINRAALKIAALLVAVQAVVQTADLFLPTGPLDEIVGVIVTGLLSAMIWAQRKSTTT